MDSLGDKLVEHARYALPSYTGKDKARKSEQYYKYKSEYETTRKKLNEVLDKKAEAKRKLEANKPKPHKTFVNSFGKATKREISSSTYKRQQRRQSKDVLRNMGVR